MIIKVTLRHTIELDKHIDLSTDEDVVIPDTSINFGSTSVKMETRRLDAHWSRNPSDGKST